MRFAPPFFVSLCFAIIIAALFFFHASRSKNTDISTTSTSSPPATATQENATTARRPPTGFLEHRDVRYHFSFFYPENLQAVYYDEGNGEGTITFQDVVAAQGFQIFIRPYAGSQVSDEVFRQDEPSGVRTNLAAISIGGAPSAAFDSKSAMLGATREFWFIHNGFLYEITTPKPLGDWLLPILQTWEFI